MAIRFEITDVSLVAYRNLNVAETVRTKLESLKNMVLSQEDFVREFRRILTVEESSRFQDVILNHAHLHTAETKVQVSLIRDVFGNPFRPIVIDPAWLTSTVVALANGIYNEKAFERMPILADALEDAGCDNEDILNHCRERSEHVRGCHVVDLILGKS